MVQSNTKSVIEAGIMAAIAIIFAVAGAYIPLLGPFVFFVWPVPIILLGVRHGYKWSIMATIVAGIIIAMLVQPMVALNIIVGFSLIGIVLGHAYRANYGPFKTLFWGSSAMVLSILASMAISMMIMGLNPFDLQLSAMEGGIGPVMEMYRSIGMPESQLAESEQTLRQFMKLARFLIPFSVITGAIFMAYLNIWISRVVLRKLGHQISSLPPFKEWSLPLWVLYVVVAVTTMLYLTRDRGEQDILYQAAINLFFLSMTLLLVQGLALFYYLADKYNLSRLIRNIILVLIIGNGLFSQIVIFAGAFDMAVDYRQLRKPR
jgi:uncharacterized protein YybS (DUF2232 family)